MAIPACLWRRTGEIYRGNKEFAALINVNLEELRDVPTYRYQKYRVLLTLFVLGSFGDL